MVLIIWIFWILGHLYPNWSVHTLRGSFLLIDVCQGCEVSLMQMIDLKDFQTFHSATTQRNLCGHCNLRQIQPEIGGNINNIYWSIQLHLNQTKMSWSWIFCKSMFIQDLHRDWSPWMKKYNGIIIISGNLEDTFQPKFLDIEFWLKCLLYLFSSFFRYFFS